MTDAEHSATPPSDMRSALSMSIGTLLSTLKAVGDGDLSQRLELNFPETHPVGALASSINFMLAALSDARTKSLAYLDELGERVALIERQREAIRDLSVPIIEVWSGVLCAPIVGVLDSTRAADVTSTLLTAVVDKKARHVIMDVTGIEVMDTRCTDHFLRIARAVTLLGARCSLSGMHPNVARTIVQMGVDLRSLQSYRTLREALKHYVNENAARRKPA